MAEIPVENFELGWENGLAIVLNDIVSHVLPLADVSKAYDIFKKKEDKCVKVILKP